VLRGDTLDEIELEAVVSYPAAGDQNTLGVLLSGEYAPIGRVVDGEMITSLLGVPAICIDCHLDSLLDRLIDLLLALVFFLTDVRAFIVGDRIAAKHGPRRTPRSILLLPCLQLVKHLSKLTERLSFALYKPMLARSPALEADANIIPVPPLLYSS
jgi:hypothetical protein